MLKPGLMNGLHWEIWEDLSAKPWDRMKAELVGDTPEDVKKARKSWLSISRAHDIAKCPAQHLGKSRLPRYFDPFAPNELGTGAHEVMEIFYQLDPMERTESALKQIAHDVASAYWSQDKLADKLPATVALNDMSRDHWLTIVLEWSLGILQVEDPKTIEMIGSEWDFKGLPSSNGVITVGSIDRVRRDLITGKIIVDDYKFGKWKGEPNPSYRDDYGMQGHWYKDVFETNEVGEEVTGVNLIYPRAPHTRQIDIDPVKVEATLVSVKQSRDDLQRYADNQRFPAKPSALCGWCDLARSCPVARLKKDNALDSASKMPSSLELGIPGGRVDDPAFDERRARVIAQEKAERDVAMSETEAKLKALISTAHSESTTTTIGVDMSQDVQAPVHPVQMAQQPQPVQQQPVMAQQPAPAQVEVQQAQPIQAPRPEGYIKDSTIQGRLDLSSFAARNASAAAEYAVYLIGEAGYGVTAVNLPLLATQLTRIARRVSHRYTGNQNMQMGSFSHSYYAMKEAIRYLARPLAGGAIPFGGTAEEWSIWSGRVENMAIAILRTVDHVFDDNSIETNLDQLLAEAFPPAISAPYQVQ